MYTYEEALKSSIEYFNGEELPAEVFLNKYALRDNDGNLVEKNPDESHRRLAKEFSRIQKQKYKNPMTEEEIYQLFYKFQTIIPQGSPLSAIGNDYQLMSASNCFVLDPPVDSYGGICKTDEELVQLSKRRGGIGIDLSNLRPEGSVTKNSSRTSTGIKSWMNRYSNSIREVGQAGRRGALMLTISCHHPDIETFITAKNNNTDVTGANISVKLTDEFLNAVKNNEDYELRFPIDSPYVFKKISANYIWDLIIKNAWNRAEPGVLFWDNIIKESPADCYKEYQTVSTNPCGEIPLSPNDSCRLFSINIFSCVQNPYESSHYFDYNKLFDLAYKSQMLMDDLVDLELEKIDQILAKIESDPQSKEIKKTETELWLKIKSACMNGRRTGLGLTCLGDSLAALNIKYGSDKSIQIVSEIYKTIKHGSYRASVDMAKELGPFPAWNWNREALNPFLNRIKNETIDFPVPDYENPMACYVIDGNKLYEEMSKYGRRNISNLTTAPVGTLSILASLYVNGKYYHNTTSGIEPLYTWVPYIRSRKGNPGDLNFRSDYVDQNGDHWMNYEVYHQGIKAWQEVTKNTDVKQSPYYQASAEEINWVQRVKLQAAAQKHIDHSISSTVNLPNDVTIEEVDKIYKAAWESGCKGVTIYRDGCRTGVLKKKDSTPEFNKTNAPKRPKAVKCDIYTISVNKNKFTVIVGLINDKPYEVFCVKDFIESDKSGEVVKHSKGKYELVTDNHTVELSNLLDDDSQNALLRMISAALRHGTDIQFVVEQLQKTEGGISSFTKSIARALKKYINDGTKSGENCTCGNKLTYQEGCLKCDSCGYSKCG